MSFTSEVVAAVADKCAGKTVQRMHFQDAALRILFTDGTGLEVSTQWGPLMLGDLPDEATR